MGLKLVIFIRVFLLEQRMLFCPHIGYKKIYRLLDRNSCYVEKLTNLEECVNVCTMIQYSTDCLTTGAQFLAEISLILIFVFDSTFYFFHHFSGREAIIHNLSSSIKLRLDHVLLHYST